MQSLLPSNSIPPRIEQLLEVFSKWHGETEMKVLKLSGGEIKQDSHCDSVSMVNAKGNRTLLRHKEFSVLVAVQEGTAWIDAKGNTVKINKGSLLIWRGDYRHAGAPLQATNRRLFVQISHPTHVPIDRDRVANIAVRIRLNN